LENEIPSVAESRVGVWKNSWIMEAYEEESYYKFSNHICVGKKSTI